MGKDAKAVFWGVVTGLALAVTGELVRMTAGSNFHTVLPGWAYRSSQLKPPVLADVIQKYKLRTIVNLRGCCDPWPWYLEECRVTHRLGVSQEDVCLSAGRLPAVHEVRRLVEVLDRTEYPILFHCHRGADRTGLAAAMLLLLHTDIDFATARRQLGLRYLHLELGRTAYLDRFLDLYTDWLAESNRQHSSACFRDWVQNHYRPGACWARVEPVHIPTQMAVHSPMAIQVRFTNLSVEPWHFRPGSNAGIHGRYVLRDPAGEVIATDRAGLFRAVVAPNESITLTLALPSLSRPGRYRLMVDLIDEHQGWFYQAGSEPLEVDLDVHSLESVRAGT